MGNKDARHPRTATTIIGCTYVPTFICLLWVICMECVSNNSIQVSTDCGYVIRCVGVFHVADALNAKTILMNVSLTRAGASSSCTCARKVM